MRANEILLLMLAGLVLMMSGCIMIDIEAKTAFPFSSPSALARCG